jgi:hypothetical protein
MADSRMIFTTWNYLDADPFADVPAATLSGPNGAWLENGDFSLSNLQTRYMADAARALDLDPAKTRIHVDFGQRRLVQCFVVLGHNLTRQATVRVAGYDDAPGSQAHAGADTGVQQVWPRYVAQAAVPFEAPNWWTGQPTMEDVARVPASWFGLLDQPRFVRSLDFFFDDQANPDGFIDIPRLFAAPVIRPKVNFLYGSQFGWQSQTTNSRSKGGVKHFDYCPPYRAANLMLQHFTKDEAYHRMLGMKSRLGLDREFFVCLDPSDVQYRQMLSFQANFAAMSLMTWSTYKQHSFETITLEEAL